MDRSFDRSAAKHTVRTKENLSSLVIQYIEEAMRPCERTMRHATLACAVLWGQTLGAGVGVCDDGGFKHQPAPCGWQPPALILSDDF